MKDASTEIYHPKKEVVDIQCPNTVVIRRKNAKSKCQFRRLDLSGFAAMGC